MHLICFIFLEQLWCAHNTHITSTLLRQADVVLTNCRVHDVPQRQSENATFMRGFTERFVGEYQQGVWDDEMWNDFMEVDVEATNKRDGLDKDGNVKMPYVVPESFKVQKKVRVVLPGVLPAQAGKGLPPVKIELEIVVWGR